MSGRLHSAKRHGQRAFTLIELLVVIAILALLAAIVTASLMKVRSAAKSFVCKNKLRNVAFDFIRFADDYSHPWRGDSDQDGRPGFSIVDFQEREYEIAEFWKRDGVPMAGVGPGTFLTEKYDASEQTMICPSGPQELERVAMVPIQKKPIVPLKHVSIGMNMRLYQTSQSQDGDYTLQDIRLSKRVTECSDIPLAFDVDGARSATQDILPYFSAPPLGTSDAYSDGAFWFPSFRHGGKLNAAFVGGHVLSTSNPVHAAGWNWREPPSVR
jgi:prepilin-type N-terminal cleavage/methylation domain-containing protein/prepilin-type processing-associated H-X9-DG protein